MIEAKTAKGRRVRKDCEDLTGQKFNYWTVLSLNPPDGGRSRWLVQCICGKRSVVPTHCLKSHSKSCGCKRNYASRKSARPAPVEQVAKPEYKAQKSHEGESPEERNYRVMSDLMKASVHSGARLRELLDLADLPKDYNRTQLLEIYPNINS